MKKRMKGVVIAIIAVSLTLASCTGSGGNDPKSLAKQSYEMYQEALKLQQKGETSGSKYETYVKKTEEINAKVEKLSEEDQEIWSEEFLRLKEAGK